MKIYLPGDLIEIPWMNKAQVLPGPDQGSGDWYRMRMGVPTASAFHNIITPAKGELSKSWRKYAYALCVERLLNLPTESVEGQKWMDRGKDLEPKAVAQYEFTTDTDTLAVSFITTDDGLIGASPDRLIKGIAAAVEIKCPSNQVHFGYLVDGLEYDDKYKPQVQGQLYVCELEYDDFYSFHPRMPPKLINTGRDEPYIDKMKKALNDFNGELFAMIERGEAMGVFQAFEHMRTPLEKEEADALSGEFEQREMPWTP